MKAIVKFPFLNGEPIEFDNVDDSLAKTSECLFRNLDNERKFVGDSYYSGRVITVNAIKMLYHVLIRTPDDVIVDIKNSCETDEDFAVCESILFGLACAFNETTSKYRLEDNNDE